MVRSHSLLQTRRAVLGGLGSGGLALAIGRSEAADPRPSVPATSADRVLRIGLHSTARPPFVVMTGDQPTGIYVDMILAIAAAMGVRIAFMWMPQVRLLQAFRQGQTDLEIGVTRGWRSAPEDAAVSLYSNTIWSVEDVLVFAPGRRFPYRRVEDIADRTIGTVIGYVYPGQHLFRRIDSYAEEDLCRSVGRSGTGVDAIIVNRLVALHFAAVYNLQLDIGPVYEQTEVFVRLHSTRFAMLAPMNTAISKLQREGVFEAVQKRYLG